MKRTAPPNPKLPASRSSPKHPVGRTVPAARRQKTPPACFARVLVPIDLSPQSQLALQYTLRLPENLLGQIWLLYVHLPPSFLHGLENIPLVRPDEKACQSEHRVLDKLLRQEVPAAHQGGTLVRIGVPDREIVAVARELGIHLIVQTTHGYHGVQHLLHPSISERVVRNAPCPVLTIAQHVLT